MNIAYMRHYNYQTARVFYEAHSGLDRLAGRRPTNTLIAASIGACTLGTSLYLCYRVGLFDALLGERSFFCSPDSGSEAGEDDRPIRTEATEAYGEQAGFDAAPREQAGEVQAQDEQHAGEEEQAETPGTAWRHMLEDDGDEDDDVPIPVGAKPPLHDTSVVKCIRQEQERCRHS